MGSRAGVDAAMERGARQEDRRQLQQPHLRDLPRLQRRQGLGLPERLLPGEQPPRRSQRGAPRPRLLPVEARVPAAARLETAVLGGLQDPPGGHVGHVGPVPGAAAHGHRHHAVLQQLHAGHGGALLHQAQGDGLPDQLQQHAGRAGRVPGGTRHPALRQGHARPAAALHRADVRPHLPVRRRAQREPGGAQLHLLRHLHHHRTHLRHGPGAAAGRPAGQRDPDRGRAVGHGRRTHPGPAALRTGPGVQPLRPAQPGGAAGAVGRHSAHVPDPQVERQRENQDGQTLRRTGTEWERHTDKHRERERERERDRERENVCECENEWHETLVSTCHSPKTFFIFFIGCQWQT